MYYIGMMDVQIDAKQSECTAQQIYEFFLSKDDYHLSPNCFWNECTGPLYTFKIGKESFEVPSGVYVCVGCETGSIDWMLSDELIGRGMTSIQMDTGFKLSGFREIALVGMRHGTMFVPNTKNPFPVASEEGNCVIIVAMVDQYHKFKHQDYGVFFVA